ncbi:MAG: tRNA pseudouridine(55) synthase TruB [Treponema sp.]|nr:tRNA pseudouridine(55) synthase TruB [Candidatus Treponema equifaecale]
MKKNRNLDEVKAGIVLLAKQSGRTSFSSLFSVKHALETGKVGHTGTLDSFADGLLVVLTGRLTRLVPHITNFDKTYLALVEFGSETDTLDPTGQVVKTGRIPTEEEIRSTLPSFTGEIDQTPPLYSALHVDGKRLSDLAREGKSVEIKSRKITVHSINLLDFYDKYALIEVNCSKGTYIRCLARDIAQRIGTCAHLKALRRTSVGPYQLKDAVGAEKLKDFTISELLKEQNAENKISEEQKRAEEDEIQARIKSEIKEFDFGVARECGMFNAILKTSEVEHYRNGRPLKFTSFYFDSELPENCEMAVYYPDLQFAGCVTKSRNRFSYGFMIPPLKQKMKVYSWEQIANGKFDADFKNKGIAATIGSFDGSHLGHQALFDAVLAQKDLVPGVITFTKSLRGFKEGDNYIGDVVTLSQKLEDLMDKGFAYAVIIDFSEDFGKLKGRDFLNILVKNCGLKYLAEGKDFHCGYKGQVDMNMMAELGLSLGFRLDTIDSVLYKDAKVSSSRIRLCIQNKEFEDVNKMLQSPYSLDSSGYRWEIQKNQKNGVTLSAKRHGKQLVPSDGTYPVRVLVISNSSKSGEAQKTRAYMADCTLEDGALHLAFSDNLISGFVRAISFGYPEENKF